MKSSFTNKKLATINLSQMVQRCLKLWQNFLTRNDGILWQHIFQSSTVKTHSTTPSWYSSDNTIISCNHNNFSTVIPSLTTTWTIMPQNSVSTNFISKQEMLWSWENTVLLVKIQYGVKHSIFSDNKKTVPLRNNYLPEAVMLSSLKRILVTWACFMMSRFDLFSTSPFKKDR